MYVIAHVHSHVHSHVQYSTLYFYPCLCCTDPPEFPDQTYSPDTLNCTEQGTSFLCAAYPGTPTVTFSCAAVGNPTPNVQISHPGIDNTATADYIITITSVRSENAGPYSCSATSSTIFPQVNVTRMFRLYVGGMWTNSRIERAYIHVLYPPYYTDTCMCSIVYTQQLKHIYERHGLVWS